MLNVPASQDTSPGTRTVIDVAFVPIFRSRAPAFMKSRSRFAADTIRTQRLAKLARFMN
jgi:hypothetical protein